MFAPMTPPFTKAAVPAIKQELDDSEDKAEINAARDGGAQSTLSSSTSDDSPPLFVLTTEQSRTTRFPEGCPVLYGFVSDDGEVRVREGIVRKVEMRADRHLAHRIEPRSELTLGHDGGRGGGGPTLDRATEEQMAYAIRCPVLVAGKEGEGEGEPGEVLFVKPVREQGRVAMRYIVQYNAAKEHCMLRMREGLTAEQLSYNLHCAINNEVGGSGGDSGGGEIAQVGEEQVDHPLSTVVPHLDKNSARGSTNVDSGRHLGELRKGQEGTVENPRLDASGREPCDTASASNNAEAGGKAEDLFRARWLPPAATAATRLGRLDGVASHPAAKRVYKRDSSPSSDSLESDDDSSDSSEDSGNSSDDSTDKSKKKKRSKRTKNGSKRKKPNHDKKKKKSNKYGKNKKHRKTQIARTDPCPVHGEGHSWRDCRLNPRSKNYDPPKPKHQSGGFQGRNNHKQGNLPRGHNTQYQNRVQRYQGSQHPHWHSQAAQYLHSPENEWPDDVSSHPSMEQDDLARYPKPHLPSVADSEDSTSEISALSPGGMAQQKQNVAAMTSACSEGPSAFPVPEDISGKLKFPRNATALGSSGGGSGDGCASPGPSVETTAKVWIPEVQKKCKSGELPRGLEASVGGGAKICSQEPLHVLSKVQRDNVLESEVADKEKARQLGSMGADSGCKTAEDAGRAGYSPKLVAQLFSSCGEKTGVNALTEEQVHITVKIPGADVGLIIGRGAMQIRNIQEKSGANVQVLSVADANDPTVRTVKITHQTQEGARTAKRMIKEILATKAPTAQFRKALAEGQAHVTVKIPDADVGFVIGKGGMQIRNIQEKSGANVQIPPVADATDPTVRTVNITHPTQEGVKIAKKMIEDILATRALNMPIGSTAQFGTALAEGQAHVTVKIPDADVGLVIGKGGMQIRNIQEKSGANVHIPSVGDTTNPTVRTVNITHPTKEGVKIAKKMIEDILATRALNMLICFNNQIKPHLD